MGWVEKWKAPGNWSLKLEQEEVTALLIKQGQEDRLLVFIPHLANPDMACYLPLVGAEIVHLYFLLLAEVGFGA